MGMTRREFLGAAAAGIMVGAGCEMRAEGAAETFEKHGSGKDLNALHGEVANAFNQEVGNRLRAQGNTRAEHFRMKLAKNDDGIFALVLQVDLVPVSSGQRPDRVFEARSTVWTGRDAKARVDANYEKSIVPWTSRMRAAYPDVVFREQIVQGGTSMLAYRACMLSGG